MSSRLTSMLAILLFLTARIAIAQEGNPAGVAPNAAPGTKELDSLEATVRELLTGLDSPTFATRQQAATELLKLDAPAVGILEKELSSASPAAAVQIRQIVARLRKRFFDDRLNAFLKSPSAETAKDLPDWDRYSKIAGTDAKAIEVFRQTMDSERTLFSMRMFASKELPSAMEARSKEFSAQCTGVRKNEFPVATCVGLMLLGSDSAVDLPRLTSTRISDAFGDDRFHLLVSEGVYAECLCRVSGAWMNRTTRDGRPGLAVDRPLLFAMEHRIPEGRTLALRTIQAGGKFQNLYYSLLCLARFGDAEDLKVVEPLLDSSLLLWPVGNQRAQQVPSDLASTYSIQACDVALAVALHLRNQDPSAFGSSARPASVTVFDVYSLGYDTDEARSAAITAYRKAFLQR